jgi:hypothetical protein
MTTSRVILYALLAAALAAAVVMPRNSGYEEPQLGEVDARMRWASDRVQIQYEMARRLQSRAVALETAARAPATPGFVVRIDPSVSDERGARVEAVARQWWTRLGPDTATASMALTVIADSTVESLGVPPSAAGRSWSSDIFIAALGGAPACNVVLRVPTLDREQNELAVSRYDVLSHCRLILRYGAPGPGVRSWLESRRYGALVARRWVHTGRANISRSPNHTYWGLRSERARQEHGCFAGRDEACTAAVLQPWSETWRPMGFPEGWLATRGPVFVDEVGALVLDRVQRSIGDEAFLALWRDTTPFAQSVPQAMQQPLSAVVRAALQDAVDPAAPTSVTRGPLSPIGGLIPPLLLLVAGLGVGSTIYGRRRSEH